MFSASGLQSQAVLTWHNDSARTGQNLQETILTPSNVSSATFGLKFKLSVDGVVDAQPLYVPSLSISGATHNVVYVATEHDTLYAFDADTGAQLWSQTVADGEQPSDERGCGQVSPEIGITSTPAIDLTKGPHGTIYLVAMTKDNSGNYHQRLHALDLVAHTEEFGGPIDVQATYPNTGGVTTFDPKQYKERAGLLILNSLVYTSWASHCDISPYSAWILGYNETTLAQAKVIDLTPNGQLASIWQAGAGPAADSTGNLLFLLANGTFDTAVNGNGFPSEGDYGNAFMNISTSGALAVKDYFTMSNTVSESNSDEDLGSGGAMVLPTLNDAMGQPHPLAVGAGKDGNAYVVDRNNMGKFNASNDSAIYQEFPLGGSVFSSPAWFNNTLYYGPVGHQLDAYPYSGGSFISASSHTSITFAYPGTTPSISANGSADGIVWAMENSSPAVLHAYDATNLALELYNSNQAGSRDNFGDGNKYMVPTIANGEVFAAATSSDNSTNVVGVFGILSNATPPAMDSVTPNSGSGASQTFTVQVAGTGGANSQVHVWFAASVSSSAAHSCLLDYHAATNQLALFTDGGGGSTLAKPGKAKTLQNSQCSLNAAASSATLNGDTLTLVLALTFKPAYVGTLSVYANTSASSSANSGWEQLGTWTVTPPVGTPAVQSLKPTSGKLANAIYTLKFSDTAGATNLQSASVWFNSTSSNSQVSSCVVSYVASSRKIGLLDDTGTTWTYVAPGTGKMLQNSQCVLKTSTVTLQGDNLTLHVPLKFKPSFAGAKNIQGDAIDLSGSNTGWQQIGTWMVP